MRIREKSHYLQVIGSCSYLLHGLKDREKKDCNLSCMRLDMTFVGNNTIMEKKSTSDHIGGTGFFIWFRSGPISDLRSPSVSCESCVKT